MGSCLSQVYKSKSERNRATEVRARSLQGRNQTLTITPSGFLKVHKV